MTLDAPIRIAGLKVSRGCMIEADTEPTETVLTPGPGCGRREWPSRTPPSPRRPDGAGVGRVVRSRDLALGEWQLGLSDDSDSVSFP